MDIIKIIAAVCTLIGTIIAAYKFFWKAPSEKKVKQVIQKAETIAIRFIALFESHGVQRNQIPEFFGHRLDIPSCATDEELLKKLTPEIITNAANLFGVNKDWLEGSSTEIYDIPSFDKYPKKFEAYLVNLLKNSNDKHMLAYALKIDKQRLVERGYDVLIVIAEPIGEVNNREVYKYHLLGRWVNRYWRSRADFAACCALLYKYKLLVSGQVVEAKWFDLLINGKQLLAYDFDENQDGVTFPYKGRWNVDEFVEIPEEFLKGMDTEQGKATGLALTMWLDLSEKGYMRCFPEDEDFHAGVEKEFKKKLAE